MEKELKQEIASAARDILQPSFLGLLRNQDDTLATRGGGKGLAIYDDIERDAFAYGVINKRKMGVVKFPWEVEPASNALRDKKAAELVKKQLGAVNFDKLTTDLLDAILKGYAVAEVVWDSDGSEIFPKKIISRNQRRFVFDEDRKIRLLTMQDMVRGEELPDRKFIVHSVGAKDGSPYGLGLGSKLFWPVFFKRQNITFWLTFADKFGSPTVVGKYPEGTLEDKQTELLDQIANIAQESAVTVPENFILELLEASRSGAGDFYEKLCRYMDEQISIAVLGETMTTTAHAAGMGSGQSNTHNDVRLELAEADADLLSETLRDSLVKWIVELNMPGANIPRVWRKVEQPEDLNIRAERDTKVKGLGYKPTLDYITETYGEGWEEAAPVDPVNALPGQTQENAAQFAEGIYRRLPDPESQLVQSTAKDWQAITDKISKMANEASSLQALQKNMVAAFGELENDELVRVMAAGFALAELKGLSDVQDETANG